MANKVTSRVENERILILEREFDAPRSLLFKMFKEPEHLKNWWGPRGWELPYCKMDFREGGTWHYCMKCVDKNQGNFYGMESWGKAVFKKINEPEMFTYTDYFSDKDGTENASMPSTTSTNTFVDLGKKTKLICRNEYATAEALKTVMDMGMIEGISQTWDRLEEEARKQL